MENHNEITSTKHRDRGFTLVELLIVIVILGVLATVTVFAVQGITDQGEESACAADIKTVEVAVEAYYAQEGQYPATLGALEGLFLKSTPDTVAFDSGTGAVTAAGSCA